MKRRSFLSSATAASVGVAGGSGQAQSNERRPPNILFILFDKCRTDAIGAYGERAVHTPNIDSLARSGMRFANCYTPQALCGPARASILTGSYPHVHGLRRNVYPMGASSLYSNYQEPIPDPFRDPRFRLWDNFPFFLNNAGYATAHIGKWHLGPANPGFFDYWKSFNSILRHWIGEPHKSRYRPDVHTGQGVKFIEAHAGEPFFLYQSYYAPHEPLDPPRQFLEAYRSEEHAGYYGAVSNLDWNVGRLVDALRRHDILDDTLIIVTTEHGRTWIDRPGTSEGMCIPYEEASRIPLIIRYPKLLPRGAVWQSGVSLVDLMPTILEVAGVQLVLGAHPGPGRPLIQGRSLVPEIVAGRDRWSRPIILENIPQRAIGGSLYEERAVRTERYKLVLRKFDVRPVFRPGELYDMAADRGETRNLYNSAEYGPTVRELAQSLRSWGQANDDTLAVELGTWAAGG
jgi:arylsulfatase A-like enzyme